MHPHHLPGKSGHHGHGLVELIRRRSSGPIARHPTRLEIAIVCNADMRLPLQSLRRSFVPIVAPRQNRALLSVRNVEHH